MARAWNETISFSLCVPYTHACMVCTWLLFFPLHALMALICRCFAANKHKSRIQLFLSMFVMTPGDGTVGWKRVKSRILYVFGLLIKFSLGTIYSVVSSINGEPDRWLMHDWYSHSVESSSLVSENKVSEFDSRCGLIRHWFASDDQSFERK